jgi:hypothetical protein
LIEAVFSIRARYGDAANRLIAIGQPTCRVRPPGGPMYLVSAPNAQ